MKTTVVGNYPKIGPGAKAPSLRAAKSKLDRGEIDLEELHRIEDEVTKEVLEDQARTGLDLVTDGHIRWDDPQTYFASGIGGFAINGLIRYFDSNTYFRHPMAEGPLHWNGPITVEDYRFATAAIQAPVKAVITGPYTLARLSQRPHYPHLRDMVMDLARILNQEARALADAGAPVVQFDEPAILTHKDDFPLFREAMDLLVDGVETETALYTYFGDISGMAGDYLKLPFDILGIDFATGPRNFELIEGFPEDKVLGLGIVDARNTRMESAEEIVESIRRVSGFVSVERLHVSPSCGLEFLPRRDAYDKLVRLVEGAARAREVLS